MSELEPNQLAEISRVAELGQQVMNGLRRSRYLAAGLAAANVLFGSYYYYGSADSGDHELLRPVGHLIGEPPASEQKVTVLEWNIESDQERHNDVLRRFARRLKPTFVDLQEVTGAATGRIMKDFRGYYGVYGVASSSLASSKFGNLLLSRLKPTDIHSYSIAGSSLLNSLVGMNIGVAEDAASDLYHSLSQLNPDASLSDAANAMQESRDDISAVFRPIIYGQPLAIWQSTTHISSNSAVENSQLGAVRNILKNRPAGTAVSIACADYNIKDQTIVRRALAKDGFTTPPRRGRLAQQNADYCSVSGPVSASFRTLPIKEPAEHVPMLLSVTFKPPPPVAEYERKAK